MFPSLLYAILTYAVDYHPYDGGHVTSQMQLLIFAMLAFVVLIRLKLYPPDIPSVVLNSDWFYRRLVPSVGMPILLAILLVWNSFLCQMRGFVNATWDIIDRIMHSPLAGPTVSGRAVLIQAGLLAVLLLISYAAAG